MKIDKVVKSRLMALKSLTLSAAKHGDTREYEFQGAKLSQLTLELIVQGYSITDIANAQNGR